jgi:hypothetical protein
MFIPLERIGSGFASRFQLDYQVADFIVSHPRNAGNIDSGNFASGPPYRAWT